MKGEWFAFALLIGVLLLGISFVVLNTSKINLAPGERVVDPVPRPDCKQNSIQFTPEQKEGCRQACKNQFEGEEEQNCITKINQLSSFNGCVPNQECKDRHEITETDPNKLYPPSQCRILRGTQEYAFSPRIDCKGCKRGFFGQACLCKNVGEVL